MDGRQATRLIVPTAVVLALVILVAPSGGEPAGTEAVGSAVFLV